MKRTKKIKLKQSWNELNNIPFISKYLSWVWDPSTSLEAVPSNNQLILSIRNKKLSLGTWQGLYLFEHRLEQHTRTLSLHLMGN